MDYECKSTIYGRLLQDIGVQDNEQDIDSGGQHSERTVQNRAIPTTVHRCVICRTVARDATLSRRECTSSYSVRIYDRIIPYRVNNFSYFILR